MTGFAVPRPRPAHWLAALSQGSDESVLLVGPDGAVRATFVSQTTADLLGCTVDDLSVEPPFGLVHPGERNALAEAFQTLLRQPDRLHQGTIRLRHRRGRYVPARLVAANCLDDPSLGSVILRIKPAPASDVVESLSHAGAVGERAELLERIRVGIWRAEREPGYGFTLLIVELERMKMMVGSYGQETVDELLVNVADRLGRLLREGDVLARLGGGEFAVFLDGVNDRKRAAKIADRMQRTIESRFDVRDQVVRCSAVVGIATSERTYTDPEHVMRDASLALNRARVRGRKGRAVFQTQMRVEDARFMAIVAELHNSVANQQLRLHYQPIVSLADGHLVGFEALLRWFHPSFGMVSPGQFIPIAEETGLIDDIGGWVMREACLQMARWAGTTNHPLFVSVNVSAKQLAHDLPGQVDRALRESGLDPQRLALELTESAVLDNRAQAVAALSTVKSRGVRLSLDDFGTGYSSFSYLHQLPYDTLKVDRSFVHRLGAAGDASDDIVHAIIVLAHNLRMTVVAEGVETADELERLRKMWCGFAQGYHFARPLEVQEATALIASAPRWT